MRNGRLEGLSPVGDALSGVELADELPHGDCGIRVNAGSLFDLFNKLVQCETLDGGWRRTTVLNAVGVPVDNLGAEVVDIEEWVTNPVVVGSAMAGGRGGGGDCESSGGLRSWIRWCVHGGNGFVLDLEDGGCQLQSWSGKSSHTILGCEAKVSALGVDSIHCLLHLMVAKDLP